MFYKPWERNGICLPQKGLAFFFSPPSENILYLTPVFLAAALLLTLIPAGEKPVRWDTLRSIAAVLEEKTNALLVHTNYIFQEAGIPTAFLSLATAVTAVWRAAFYQLPPPSFP